MQVFLRGQDVGNLYGRTSHCVTHCLIWEQGRDLALAEVLQGLCQIRHPEEARELQFSLNNGRSVHWEKNSYPSYVCAFSSNRSSDNFAPGYIYSFR